MSKPPIDIKKINDIVINNDVSFLDWEPKVIEAGKAGDLDGMRRAALPSLQFEIIKAGHEALELKDRLNAAQYVMEQAGQGPIKRMEVQHNYDRLPEDQLIVILQSKIDALRSLNPNLDFSRLIPPKIVDAEFDEALAASEAKESDG